MEKFNRNELATKAMERLIPTFYREGRDVAYISNYKLAECAFAIADAMIGVEGAEE